MICLPTCFSATLEKAAVFFESNAKSKKAKSSNDFILRLDSIPYTTLQPYLTAADRTALWAFILVIAAGVTEALTLFNRR